MQSKNKIVKDYTGGEFVFTREFDAPREKVFEAWTDQTGGSVVGAHRIYYNH